MEAPKPKVEEVKEVEEVEETNEADMPPGEIEVEG